MTNSTDGSSRGIRGRLGRATCPCSSKKRTNEARTSSPVRMAGPQLRQFVKPILSNATGYPVGITAILLDSQTPTAVKVKSSPASEGLEVPVPPGICGYQDLPHAVEE